MSEAKLSEWFPASQEPWEPGVYEVRSGGSQSLHSFWNGAYWCGRTAKGPEVAATDYYLECQAARPITRWRGLAEKPDA